MAHDTTRHFDAEDMRLLMSLSAYASAGPQVMSALEIEQNNRVRREREAPTKTARLGHLLAAISQQQPTGTIHRTGKWPFQRLLEKLPVAAYTCDPDGLTAYFN